MAMMADIKHRHRIAVKVNKIYEETKKEQSIYGENFLHRLAIALGLKSAGPFYEMIRVAKRWPTYKVLEEEILDRVPDLNWKKLVLLARKDAEELENMSDETLALPTAELRKALMTDSPRPGRTPAPLSSLSELENEVTEFCRNVKNVLMPKWKKFDFAGLKDQDGNFSDDDYLKLVAVAQKLSTVGNELADFADWLSELVKE